MDRPRDLRHFVDRFAEALEDLRCRRRVERDRVLDAGRVPLLIEVAIYLDRYTRHVDAKPSCLAVCVIQDAQSYCQVQHLGAVGDRRGDNAFISPLMVQHDTRGGAETAGRDAYAEW